MASRQVPTGCACGILAIACVGAVVVAVLRFEGSHLDSRDPQPARVDLSATVRFTGTQIVVANLDDFDWGRCRAELNPRLRGGWKHQLGDVAAGSTVKVGAMLFTKGDGERFTVSIVPGPVR